MKKSRQLAFKPLAEAIKEPETVISDFCKLDDTHAIHLAFQTTYEYQAKFNRLPRPWNQEDSNEFIRLAHELNDAKYKFETVSDYALRLFSSTLIGQISPMHAVIGGTTAQEVLKACSGKFTPIKQYFYFDCRECLLEKPFENLNPSDYIVSETDDVKLRRYKSQIAVFGRKFQQKLGRSKYFVVGAGALGCEYIKNLAMMGMCTKTEQGQLIITDMDTIEKSNLNRFVFFYKY